MFSIILIFGCTSWKTWICNDKGMVHFYFEDGVRAKFLGLMWLQDQIPRIMKPQRNWRNVLRAWGVNVIRLHAADAPISEEPRSWSSCKEAPLLDYEKGNGREFHPEGLDRFDYFVAKLKERGIYLHIDLIVARDFVEGDGLDYPGNAGSCIKRFPMYNKRMIELQKEYARKILCHVNPYTGLALIDDPAVITVQINNEDSAIKGTMETDQREEMQPYRDEVQNRFNSFLLMKYGTRERLINQFKTILDGRSDIRNLGIIGSNGRKLINEGKQSVNPDLKLSTQEWYLEALQKPEGPLLTSSHVQHIISGERPWVITLSRGIRNFSNSGEKEGVFFIDLNYSAISELCDQNTIGKKGYAFILDESGNIVYHPQQQQLYNELQTENIDLIVKSKEDTVRTEKGNRGKLYSISRSNKTGWTVVGCMSVSELLRKSNQAQSIYVLISALLMIVALLFSRFLAKSLTYPLQRLRDSMSRVQEGHFDGADVEIDSENEIGSLTKSFNVMTHRIQDLMEQNVKEQEAKRKSELKALQSQINPHFLYNTLDSIIWMAEGRKYEEVVLMTASLARLLRQSISNEDEVVPLAREVEYAKGYLTIQKMRYKDKLEFEIDVELLY